MWSLTVAGHETWKENISGGGGGKERRKKNIFRVFLLINIAGGKRFDRENGFLILDYNIGHILKQLKHTWGLSERAENQEHGLSLTIKYIIVIIFHIWGISTSAPLEATQYILTAHLLHMWFWWNTHHGVNSNNKQVTLRTIWCFFWWCWNLALVNSADDEDCYKGQQTICGC